MSSPERVHFIEVPLLARRLKGGFVGQEEGVRLFQLWRDLLTSLPVLGLRSRAW